MESGLSLLTSAAGSCRAGCGWEDGSGGGDYRVKYVTRYDEVDKPDEATAALCVCLTPNKTQGPVITMVCHHYFIISKTRRLVVVSFPCYFCHTLCLPAELPVAVLSPEMSCTPPSGGCGLGVGGGRGRRQLAINSKLFVRARRIQLSCLPRIVQPLLVPPSPAQPTAVAVDKVRRRNSVEGARTSCRCEKPTAKCQWHSVGGCTLPCSNDVIVCRESNTRLAYNNSAQTKPLFCCVGRP